MTPAAPNRSSLKILHEMGVLTATDPPAAAAVVGAPFLPLGNLKEVSSSASASSSSPLPAQDSAVAAAAAADGDPFAYLHDTTKEIQPMSTGAESAAAIDKFHKVPTVDFSCRDNRLLVLFVGAETVLWSLREPHSFFTVVGVLEGGGGRTDGFHRSDRFIFYLLVVVGCIFTGYGGGCRDAQG